MIGVVGYCGGIWGCWLLFGWFWLCVCLCLVWVCWWWFGRMWCGSGFFVWLDCCVFGVLVLLWLWWLLVLIVCLLLGLLCEWCLMYVVVMLRKFGFWCVDWYWVFVVVFVGCCVVLVLCFYCCVVFVFGWLVFVGVIGWYWLCVIGGLYCGSSLGVWDSGMR